MNQRTWMVALAALVLLGPAVAGCIGNDDETEPGTNSSAGDGNMSTEPSFEPVTKNWTDSATSSAPWMDNPGASTAEFVQTSLENGANGTYVLGYDVNVPENASKLAVTLAAEEVDPQSAVPDYDLYVYDPEGAVVGQSTNQGTDETVTVSNTDTGTYLIGILYWAGADAEENIEPVVIGAELT